MTDIQKDLFSMRDLQYALFQSKLMPTVPSDTVIGVRMPDLRAYAKNLHRSDKCDAFLQELPHRYYEENNLHGLLLMQERDFARCICELDRFLPHVDNWATCDMLRPKCFAAHRRELVPYIERWMTSDCTYTVRFGIEMLMVHYLQDDFHERYMDMVSIIDHNDYYVNMMCAWYFATALGFQYEAAVRYLETGKLPPWIHNKTIQKAVESNRIPEEVKRYLRTLRRK